eukprot:771182-Pleurochrysis_carterae.AAC.1
MHGVDCGDSLFGRSMIFGCILHPMGRTPAHDGTLPENKNHADSVGVSRDGRMAATSVNDFRWYHQKDIGSFD